MAKEWYQIENIDRIDSPALVVYKDRVIRNIESALEIIGDPDRLRPHVKTNKSPAVCLLLLEKGISRFKCATIAEAEMLGRCGAPDVLLAYQPVGPKINRFLRLMEKFPETQFSCLADNLLSAAEMAKQATEENAIIRIFIDLNIGMDRTGILPGEDAHELSNFIRNTPGLHFAGLHAYDGHLHQPDFEERKSRADQEFSAVEKIAHQLREEGSEIVIVAGGSPTFPVHAPRKGVECSPGTFVFWDKGYEEKCPEQDFLPAALVVSRVISKIDENTFCLDLGHKSIAPENPLERRVHFYNAPELTFTGQSEEHLVVKTPNKNSLKIGEVLYGVPIHICPTVALHNDLKVIENHRFTQEWPVTARTRKITV